MNILVIDTATPVEIVASCAGSVCASASAPVASSHAASLMESIDTCLKGAGVAPADLDLIGVGLGPGSFTGIRVAVATARMMAQALERPLAGFPTHLLYAASAGAEPGGQVLVAFDAKKGRVFGALYRTAGPGLPEEIVPPGDYAIDFLLERANPDSPAHLIGDGVARYRDAVTAALPGGREMPGFIPPAEAACGLARVIYEADPGACADWNGVLPLYARKSDAEIAREAGGNP